MNVHDTCVLTSHERSWDVMNVSLKLYIMHTHGLSRAVMEVHESE